MSRLMTSFSIVVLEGQFVIVRHRFCHMKRKHCMLIHYMKTVMLVEKASGEYDYVVICIAESCFSS